MSNRVVIVGTCLVALLQVVVAPARAEHRVALLIGNSAYKAEQGDIAKPDLNALKGALEKFGFRCQILTNLENESAFRNAIEGFANRTPTRSTALIYFSGRLGEGPGFLGVDSRSKYALNRTLAALKSRGGSRNNLIFVAAHHDVEFKGPISDGFLLSFGDTKALQSKLADREDLVAALKAVGKTTSNLPRGTSVTGKGSQTISPPDKFAQGAQAGDEWVNDMGLVFCWCPPGKYTAGSPENEPARYPDETQRDVTISDGFWLAKYELALSQRVAKRGPGRTIATKKLHPMTMINHDDAKHMTRNFSESQRKANRLPSDWEYALPTEQQWEYAARAGTRSRFYFGDDLNLLPKHANFADKTYYDTGDIYSNSAHRTLDDGAAKLALVGSYQANPWGFHDMYGNVAEWCINYATRGGSWSSVAENCRSAYRDTYASRNQQNFIGYRLVIQKTPPAKPKSSANQRRTQ